MLLDSATNGTDANHQTKTGDPHQSGITRQPPYLAMVIAIVIVIALAITITIAFKPRYLICSNDRSHQAMPSSSQPCLTMLSTIERLVV